MCNNPLCSILQGAYKIPKGYNEGSMQAKTLLAGKERYECSEYEVYYQ